ncbi:MAG: glycerol-3-phosphate 1-O-acyltransferase PlsY [Desulfonauticus sp.]|nr:glycerol-3-phosphate 1-O-acyltransferase PlsY [Desulfonauticus sp.]
MAIVYFAWWTFAYLCGAFPFGLFISQMCCRIDPRLHGSKNIGATNVCRVCGLKYGLMVLVLDLLKGFLPVYVGQVVSNSPWFLSLTAFLAIVGHMFSVFLYGKGGKGVATTVGVYLALFPSFLLAGLLFFVFAVWLTGYVSVGSILFVSVVPIFLLFSEKACYFPLSLAIAVLVIVKHKANIERLILGTEKSWRER